MQILQWKLPRQLPWITVLLGSILLAACTPLIAGYSLQAYTNATDLKAETLAMIDKSGEPYKDHATEVEALRTRIDAAYEFSAGTQYNREASLMWGMLRDRSESSLLGSFFKRWSANGVTRPAYRERKRRFVALAFDRLICLEANKKEATKCPPMNPATPDAEAEDE